MRVVLWAPKISRAQMEAQLHQIAAIELISVDDIAGLEAVLPETEVLVLPVFHFSAQLAAALRERAPKLRLIQLMTIGYDRLLQEKLPAGVRVANAGSSLSPIVAEHALALMLALGRRVHEGLARQAQRQWDGSYNSRMASMDSKLLAIVGYGAIGREIARRARPFGTRIIGISRSAAPDELADEVRPATQLDDVLPEADIVAITLPLSPQTKGLFNAARLATMKHGAMLINVARGPIVDSHALAAALQSGALCGAGLDVADPEPLPAEHPLWQSPNLILSPHIAVGGGYRRLAMFCAENVQRVSWGTEPHALIPLS